MTKSLRPGTLSNDSAAPSVSAWPRNTVPSRSRSRQSYCCASVPTSAELAHSVFGVGDTLDVGRRGAQKPLQRLVAAVEREQCLRVGVEQPGRDGPGPRRIQLRCGQYFQGLFELTKVYAAGARRRRCANSSASSPPELGRFRPSRRASSSARSGRPRPRSQSTISGSNGDLLPILRAARSSASACAQSPHR